MAALTGDRPTYRVEEKLPAIYCRLDAEDGVTYYFHGLIADVGGVATKVTGVPGLKIRGFCDRKKFVADTDDPDLAYVDVMAGLIELDILGSDPVTASDYLAVVYAENDGTCRKTSNGGTRSPIGRLIKIVTYAGVAKALVEVGMLSGEQANGAGGVGLRSVTVAHGDLTAAATSEAINIGSPLPAGARIVGVSIDLATPFSGGSATAVTVDIGSSGDVDAIVDGANLFAAAVDGQASTLPAGIAPNKKFSAATQLIATFISDVNVAALTAGSCTINVLFTV
jgi:hypothetical protein